MSEIKPGKRYFSVVFEVLDPEKFDFMAKTLSANQVKDEPGEGWGAKVTACGWGDYATGYDALEHHVRANGFEADQLIEEYVLEEELSVTARDITG